VIYFPAKKGRGVGGLKQTPSLDPQLIMDSWHWYRHNNVLKEDIQKAGNEGQGLRDGE